MSLDKFIKCSARLLTVILIFNTSEIIVAQWIVEDYGCITPNLGVGDCIPIKECQPLLMVREQLHLLPANIVDELDRYYCGVTPKSVKVCCPRDLESLNYLIPISRKPEIVSIFNHRNLILLPEECGLRNEDVRIMHGNISDLFEFPWMALLSYNIGGQIDFRCGGTIINDRYILTAAHCIANLGNRKLIGVRLGEHNISSLYDCTQPYPNVKICAEKVQDVAIANTIPHPEYNPKTFVNDIGLIRLAWSLNTSVDNVRPICLPTTKELTNQNFHGENFTVSGWGITETGRRSQVLLKVNIPVLKLDTCINAYQHTVAKISDQQICAGGKRGDSCGGDSGGPLQTLKFHHNDVRCIQHGIVSFGPKRCATRGYPSIYTRVDKYMDWILDNLE